MVRSRTEFQIRSQIPLNLTHMDSQNINSMGLINFFDDNSLNLYLFSLESLNFEGLALFSLGSLTFFQYIPWVFFILVESWDPKLITWLHQCIQALSFSYFFLFSLLLPPLLNSTEPFNHLPFFSNLPYFSFTANPTLSCRCCKLFNHTPLIRSPTPPSSLLIISKEDVSLFFF
jgi:hypothetical protein